MTWKSRSGRQGRRSTLTSRIVLDRLNDMNNINWSYLAGLFDGEGTFTISKGRRKGYPDYSFEEIYITNSNKEIMDWLVENFGGSVRITRHGDKEKNWKDVYKWFLPAKRRKEFIKNITPLLIIKRKQALLLLEYISLVESQNGKIRGVKGLTDSERSERERILTQVRALNRRGVK